MMQVAAEGYRGMRMSKKKKKISGIDKTLQERDEYYKKTGKFLSYGQFIAMKQKTKSSKH